MDSGPSSWHSFPVEDDETSSSQVLRAPTLGSSNSTRRRSASFMAVHDAVLQLTRMNDFVMEKISEGFFAEVYKAQHISTGEVMVLKKNKLFKNSKQMLYEIQLMNRLSHPNILHYKGCCVHEGQLHALTEYMNAGTVEDWLLSKSPIPWSVRIKICRDIAAGMAYLHFKGVFHRDLTSKNCLLHQENDTLRIVVADFGLAADIQKYKLHHHNDVVGSPYWMAPECLFGKPYAEKADVFSYGIILAESMARIPADPEYMPRTNKFGMDFDVLQPMCQGSPETLWQLMVQCCQMDPEVRPTFAQAVEMLNSIDLSTCDLDTSKPKNSCNNDGGSSSLKEKSSEDSRNTNWRRHSSCSDPGDVSMETTKCDSGIDPGVCFAEQRKHRLSSSCGALLDQMEEVTTLEELELYLKTCNTAGSDSSGGKASPTVSSSSPVEIALGSQTTSPQLVTPSVCKVGKSYQLPDPSTPCAPPPTPCTSTVRPAASMPLLQAKICDDTSLPRAASSELLSPDTSPCIRRRRVDVKAKELFPLASNDAPYADPSDQEFGRPDCDALPENGPIEFCVVESEHRSPVKFPYGYYPKRQVGSPLPDINKLTSPFGSNDSLHITP